MQEADRAASAPIQHPTVSRRLWYWPSPAEVAARGMRRIDANQPLDAGVLFVWNEREVNVMVTDHIGNLFPTPNAPLVHPGEEPPATKGYCTWMPYQSNKHNAERGAGETIALNVVEQGERPQQAAGTARYADADVNATRHPGASLGDVSGIGAGAGTGSTGPGMNAPGTEDVIDKDRPGANIHGIGPDVGTTKGATSPAEDHAREIMDR